MTQKSATVKPKGKKREKITNESKLNLPQDIGSFTVNFRREAARSIGRIMADQAKLDVFLELLDIFRDYANDRFEEQIVTRDRALADKAAKLKAAEQQALRDADAIIAGKRAHMNQLQAEVAAHDEKMAALK